MDIFTTIGATAAIVVLIAVGLLIYRHFSHSKTTALTTSKVSTAAAATPASSTPVAAAPTAASVATAAPKA